jgi:hypothetical protein
MAHQERLKIKNASAEDAWKDIVRIPNKHRRDHNNKHISRGRVCCVTVGKRSKWVIVHGLDTQDAVIRMDLNVRLALKLKNDHDYDFTFRKLGWLQTLWFPWRASDPIFRLPGQLGLIALFFGLLLGGLGIYLGLIPLYNEYQKNKHVQQSTKIEEPNSGYVRTDSVAKTGDNKNLNDKSQADGKLDFVSIWKASSIVLTGGFGILGLLKDFKEKDTNKVTKWGRISLAGIVFSTVFGVAAQIKESFDSAQQTLAVVTKSDKTIRDIQRLLSPLDDEPNFVLWFTVDCASAKYKPHCEGIQKIKKAKRDKGEPFSTEDGLTGWSQGIPAGKDYVFLPKIEFLATQKDADEFCKFERAESDLSFQLFLVENQSKKDPRNTSLMVDGFNDEIRIGISGKPASSFTKSNGKLKSILDLPGAIVLVRELNDDLSRLTLTHIEVKFRNGQSITYYGPFERIAAQGTTAYRFTVPKDEFTR